MTELRNSPLLKITAMLIAVISVVAIVVLFYLFTPANPGRDIELNIYEGSGLNNIASTLKEAKAIRSRNIFIIYAIISGKDKTIKAGRYIIEKGSDMPTILSKLAEGRSEPDDMVVTIPEGLNVWEIDELLVKKGLIRESDFAKINYLEEGFLFPDTYRLKDPQRFPDADLIAELTRKMSENYDISLSELLGSFSAGKQREIIIIASILEKEAKTAEDMATVSGIIQARLKKGMKLEVDASVVYGACLREFLEDTSKDCDVTFIGPAIEIKKDSEYNSYMRTGLPVGPISNPGLKAIKAALNPVETDYLYYLSTRDGSQLIFSKTAVEHTKNRRQYLGI
jgi:UPF0755 protein